MTGLYSAIFGEHPDAKMVKTIIVRTIEGADEMASNVDAGAFFGRYRDAWLEHHGDVVLARVHTRNGGGNREAQAEAIEAMRAHPWYLNDEDDEFDPTYADFYFLVDLEAVGELAAQDIRTLHEAAPDIPFPEGLTMEDAQEAVRAVARLSIVQAAIDPVDNGARWAEAIERAKADPDEAARVFEAMDANVVVMTGDGRQIPFSQLGEELS